MTALPEKLRAHFHAARYFRTWQRNRRSIVFVPLAEICRQSGCLAEALEICEQGLAFNPRSVSGRMTLARIYRDLGLEEKALPVVEGVLQDVPDHPEAEILRRQMRSDPPRQEIWETCTMAQVLGEQGETAAAQGIVEKILTRNPTDRRAMELKEALCRKRS